MNLMKKYLVRYYERPNQEVNPKKDTGPDQELGTEINSRPLSTEIDSRPDQGLGPGRDTGLDQGLVPGRDTELDQGLGPEIDKGKGDMVHPQDHNPEIEEQRNRDLELENERSPRRLHYIGKGSNHDTDYNSYIHKTLDNTHAGLPMLTRMSSLNNSALSVHDCVVFKIYTKLLIMLFLFCSRIYYCKQDACRKSLPGQTLQASSFKFLESKVYYLNVKTQKYKSQETKLWQG